jgi:hypothetical protein
MTSDGVVSDPLASLIAKVSEVDFKHLDEFQSFAEMGLFRGLEWMFTSPEAKAAAGEADRECRALAEDLRLAGSAPSCAWERVLFEDRYRARASIRRFVESQPHRYVGRGIIDGLCSGNSGAVPSL